MSGETLAEWMDSQGMSINELTRRANVIWRTARDAREGRLGSVHTARKIAAACGKGEDEHFVASMLQLTPPESGDEEAA